MDLSTRQGRREQGQLIQKSVERAGLSVEDLANRIGCSRALIYQYLSGTTLAQPDRLQQIAQVTGVPLVFFFGAAESDAPKRGGRKGAEREDPQARITERIGQWEELARALEGPPDWSALATTCERIVSLASQIEDEPAEARALLRLGKASVRRGEFSRAVESLVRAADLFSRIRDAQGETETRQALGNAYLATGRIQEARQQFEHVAASERWQEKWMGAVSLAAVFEQLGDYRQAMQWCDDAAAILDEATPTQDAAKGQLYVNANRVNIYLACGDYISAEPLASRCLEDAESYGLSDQHLEARLSLGLICFAKGDWPRAYKVLTTAVQLSRFLGDKSREAMARGLYATLLAALGLYDTATEYAKDALASALSHGDRRTEFFAQSALAEAYDGAGRATEARYHANQALAVTSALRHAQFEAECRLRLARMALKSSEPDEAKDHIDRALASARKLGARHIEAEGELRLAQYLLSTQDLPEGAKSAEGAVALATELELNPIIWQAETELARSATLRSPADLNDAVTHSQHGIDLLEEVRLGLTNAGIADTLLEDSSRLGAYTLHGEILQSRNETAKLQAFLDQAGWPPLSDRFQRAR
jgi:tetratricopeptide (TPR) repeat protein